MPEVTRSRTVAAPQDRVWELVSDPFHLPRWWPATARVEDATDDAWTSVLKTPSGATVRADFTRVERQPPRRIVWRQELEESPFERVFSSAVTAIELEPDGETRPRAWRCHRRRAAARALPARRLDRAPGRAAPARRGARRHRRGGRVRATWSGWGEPPPFPEQLLKLVPGLTGRHTPAVSLEEVSLPESRLPEARCAPSPRTDREERILHAAGKSYPDLIRLRSGDASARRTEFCTRSRTTRWRGCSRSAPRRASPWCPSAAARAWWAGWSRCAGSSSRWSRSTSPASTT